LYAFQNRTWRQSKFQIIELQKVWRQAKDEGLVQLLTAVREGQIRNFQSKHGAALSALQAPLPLTDDGIVLSKLHSKNLVVDNKNKSELTKLQATSRFFEALDEVKFDPIYKQRLLLKHKVEGIVHMPYLWQGVEPVSLP
jgi:hypothetical protein